MDSWFQRTIHVSPWPSYLGNTVVALVIVPAVCAFPLALIAAATLELAAFVLAAIIAGLAGYFCEKWSPRPVAHWVWTAGVLWISLTRRM